MTGHNMWSKVKHIKARVDAIKGRVFNKYFEVADEVLGLLKV